MIKMTTMNVMTTVTIILPHRLVLLAGLFDIINVILFNFQLFVAVQNAREVSKRLRMVEAGEVLLQGG